MTLATHAVVGAALASAVPDHPGIAFALGFASHFVMDAIPHWHYPLATLEHDRENPLNNDMHINRQFPFDLAKIFADAVLGIALSFFFFHPSSGAAQFTLLAGAVGAMLPDPLQFVYWKFRHEPMYSLQRFHMWMHARKDFDDNMPLGVTLQALLILAAVVLADIAHIA